MRLLMVTDFYHPFLGGVEQHVRTLSHALTARGHHVAVATLRHGDLAEQEEDDGVTVYRIPSTTSRAATLFKNPGRPWAAPMPDPESAAALRRVVQREQPDIVHGHDWLSRSYLPLKPFYRAKFVVSQHYYTLSCAKKNLIFEEQPCTGPGMSKCLRCASAHYGVGKGSVVTLGNWGSGAVERQMADAYISVSHATAQGNQLKGNSNKSVIPNFVRDSVVEEDAALAAYVAQLPSEPFILFVGDLRRDKGIDTLLGAYEQLTDAPPLVLIGKLWEESPKTFLANVHFFKEWSNAAVLAAWKRSLFGVVPSQWAEPFGIVVIEAMMAGKPVIGSRIGGIPEIITHEENGLLVEAGNVDVLRDAMQRLINNPKECQQMGGYATLRAQNFRVEIVVPQIESLYISLLV